MIAGICLENFVASFKVNILIWVTRMFGVHNRDWLQDGNIGILSIGSNE